MKRILIAVICLIAMVIASCAGATSYKMIDLGTLGGKHSVARSMNDKGQIVGYSTDVNGTAHAVLWENGTIVDLGTLDGSNCYAYDINNNGCVVGYSEGLYTESHAFLWKNGVMTDLYTPGSYLTSAIAINDNNQIIGYGIYHNGAIWENGITTDLGKFDGARSMPDGINNNGQVVGCYFTSEGYRAFLWENGTLNDLGTFGGTTLSNYGIDINDNGQIAGAYVNFDNDTCQAFFLENGSITPIGPARTNFINPVAINNKGLVAGNYGVNDFYHAFLWENGTMIDLGSLNGVSAQAIDINNKGQIVGLSSYNGDHFSHAVLWEPIPDNVVPEPSSIVVLAGGLIPLFGIIRRRRA